MRRSHRLKTKSKNKRDPRAKILRLKLDPEMIAGRSDILPSLPNMQDNLVVHELSTAKIGALPVDRFGSLLCADGRSPGESHTKELRLALIQVYFAAADARRSAKASKDQLNKAKAALATLTRAIDQLDQTRPRKQRGFQGAFGSPMDDFKGLDESNDFGARCSKIQMDIVSVMMDLSGAIETEKKFKLTTAGERKKRLRTLVEALAHWWKSVTGKSLVPYVQAKKRDDAPALVVGRYGPFIELAQALFSRTDGFKDSEVISTVTNVDESLAQQNKIPK
jgi:hypothetical protein